MVTKLMILFFFIVCPHFMYSSDSEIQQPPLTQSIETALEYPYDIYPWYDLVSKLTKPLQILIFKKIMFPLGEPQVSMQVEGEKAPKFAQSNDQSMLAFSLRNKCFLLNSETLKITLLVKLEEHENELITALAFSKDDRKLALSTRYIQHSTFMRIIDLPIDVDTLTSSTSNCSASDSPEYKYNCTVVLLTPRENDCVEREKGVFLTYDADQKIIMACKHGRIYRYNQDSCTFKCLLIDSGTDLDQKELSALETDSDGIFPKEVRGYCRQGSAPLLLASAYAKRSEYKRSPIKQFNFDAGTWDQPFSEGCIPAGRIIQYNNEGTLLLIGAGGRMEGTCVEIWDLRQGKLIRTIPYLAPKATSLSANAQFLLSASKYVNQNQRKPIVLFAVKTGSLIGYTETPHTVDIKAVLFHRNTVLLSSRSWGAENQNHNTIQIISIRPVFSYFAAFLEGTCSLEKFVFVKFLDDCFKEGLILTGAGIQFNDSPFVRVTASDKSGIAPFVQLLVRKKNEKMFLERGDLVKTRADIQRVTVFNPDNPYQLGPRQLSETSKERLRSIWEKFSAEEQAVLQKEYFVSL